MKIHRTKTVTAWSKADHAQIYYYRPICEAKRVDLIASTWKNVTCKRCLAKRPKEKS
jgi:hypothetical protein